MDLRHQTRKGKKQRLHREKRAVGLILRIKSLLSNVCSPVSELKYLKDVSGYEVGFKIRIDLKKLKPFGTTFFISERRTRSNH